MKKKMYVWLCEIAEEKNGFTLLSSMINDQSLVEKSEVEKAISNSKEVFKERAKEGRKYFCAFIDTQNSFGLSGFKRALEVSKSSEMILGGWANEGKVYFDSIHNYFTLKAAKENCLRESQLEFAYFNDFGEFEGTYKFEKEKWSKV
jgi:hypothetical protein